MNTDSLPIMLRSLRLPSVLACYQELTGTATANNWSFEQYLRTVLEVEIEDRTQRRTARLLKHSGLPDGKTLNTLNTALFPPELSAVSTRLCKVEDQRPGLKLRPERAGYQ